MHADHVWQEGNRGALMRARTCIPDAHMSPMSGQSVCAHVSGCGASVTAASLLGLKCRERHDERLEEKVNGAEEHVDQVEQLLHQITPHNNLSVDDPRRRALRTRGRARRYAALVSE